MPHLDPKCHGESQIRSHVNFGNNLREAKANKKVRFYFATQKWHRSTCYVNWAILIGDPIEVTTLLLIIPKSVVRSGRNSNSSEILYMPSLPSSIKRIG